MPDTLSLVRQRVSEAISQWRSGQQLPDARGFLYQHPEVKAAQSLVVDLAYEEFCLRQEAGERIDTEKFLGCFPTVQHSLARMLDVHGAMGSQAQKIGLETQWPETGTRWLDWDLIEPLGRGAFSRVFVAREPALGNREVVVKCSFAGPHEAFVLGSLSHANIVPVHSSRHDDELGLTGISMPLLGRSTLADALNRLAAEGNAARSPELFRQVASGGSPLSPPRAGRPAADYALAAIALIQRVSQGLAAAHRVGVVHGDIKPSNILLSFAGEPMLMDFNLSAGPGGDFERAGGTPPYMAPECLADFFQAPSRSAAARTLDPRSDLFSLGVVLLELLLGGLPFRFDFGDPQSLPTEQDWRALIDRSGAPASLRTILQRCLAFDPTQRYASADELAGDLAAILAAKERIRRWTRRAIVASAASVVLGTSVTLWALNLEDPNSPRALLRRAKGHIDNGEFGEAASLLAQVQKKRTDPRVTAWLGYCLAEQKEFHIARPLLIWATGEFPLCAELWNDLGYCSMRCSRPEAEEEFTRSIKLDPTFQAAIHNRAALQMNQATSLRSPLPDGTWYDFKRALALGPSGQLHLDAARAIAHAHRFGPNVDGVLEQHVERALIGGVNPASFQEASFQFEKIDLPECLKRAASFEGKPIPASAPLLVPPPFPLPES